MVTVTRRQIKHGADWIKIHATGSIPNHDGELQVWTLDEMKAVCDTAHDLGVPVVAHCRSSSVDHGTRPRAGVDLILHASYADDEALEAVVESGAAICPTFTFLANLADYGHQVGAGAGMRDIFVGEIKATAGVHAQRLRRRRARCCAARRAASPSPRTATGTPASSRCSSTSSACSGLEAITCATRNNAFAMRMEGELGVVGRATGPTCLVVDGDPAADVGSSRTAAGCAPVVSRGEPVDLDEPWPQRRPIAGERVAAWAAESLTMTHRNAHEQRPRLKASSDD